MNGKPNYVSHYLVLKDLINNVDVRQYNDNIVYLTSRIENIKNNLKDRGLQFDEEATRIHTKYSDYKPYVLIDTDENIKKAKALLDSFLTKQVRAFLELAE